MPTRIVSHSLNHARKAAKASGFGPRHLAESIARGLGYKTQAALIADLNATPLGSLKSQWSEAEFKNRILELEPQADKSRVDQACASITQSFSSYMVFSICLAKTTIDYMHNLGGGQIIADDYERDGITFRINYTKASKWPVKSDENEYLTRALRHGFNALVGVGSVWKGKSKSSYQGLLSAQFVGLNKHQLPVRIWYEKDFGYSAFIVNVSKPIKTSNSFEGLGISSDNQRLIIQNINSNPGIRMIFGKPNCGKSEITRIASQYQKQNSLFIDLTWWQEDLHPYRDSSKSIYNCQEEAVIMVQKAKNSGKAAIVLMPTVETGWMISASAILANTGAAVWLPVTAESHEEGLHRVNPYLGSPPPQILMQWYCQSIYNNTNTNRKI